ncbi:MAG: A/G-specific adenine glycosylase [Clostridiales bacterium]|nr:A/G-specific adenine glycosylase [Clostridiales bacterium]
MTQISEPLLAWYDRNARILPFRDAPSPYRTWISEIMLQQTRVSAVLPYYERFMQALPDVRALAEVEEDELLKLWEGLGYYSRARNLKKAAQMVMEQYEGEIPHDFEQLRKLPGIGDYTAGAIASIACGQKVPAVDGNVLRVLSRVLLFRADILEPKVKKAASALIQGNMPDRPGDYNQALMELGAMVCVPNGEPLCGQCPLREICQAKAAGCEKQLPVKAPKKPRKAEKRTIVVVCAGGKVLLHQRPKRGLLAGMYEFVNLDGRLSQSGVQAALAEMGLAVREMKDIGAAVHIFTHREWHMNGFGVIAERSEPLQGYVWADRKALAGYAIPGAFAAYKEQLPLWMEQSLRKE